MARNCSSFEKLNFSDVAAYWAEELGAPLDKIVERLYDAVWYQQQTDNSEAILPQDRVKYWADYV